LYVRGYDAVWVYDWHVHLFCGRKPDYERMLPVRQLAERVFGLLLLHGIRILIMGQKYAAQDAQLGIAVFYDSVDSPVPAGVSAIEITEAQWQACLSAWPPYTVANGTLVEPAAPTAAALLAAAQNTQIAVLNAAYEAAINAPVSFTTAAGVTGTFNQDSTAKANLQDAMLASEKTGVWPINLWLTAAGSPVTPFTYADLQGLAVAMEAIDAPDYQQLLTLIGQVGAATTVAAVQAIVWP
jgi:hypothetical protein